ncbi:hypothetical protein [Aquiflexum sp.]|uniref:hypothetical protein n=1 Tax=Aquiflexum sp. TaxID=1872584 RepID=UPI0035947E4F
MKSKHWYSLYILVFISSCAGDVDKVITTDLQAEGNEIFRVSLALEESLFFAFRTFEDFKKTDTIPLPGCPEIMVNEVEKKVTLQFSAQSQCTTNHNLSRSGKINIKYITTNVLETVTRLEYEDYKVKGYAIEGTRDFKQIRSLLNPNRRTESFEDILIINETGSSTRLKGEAVHNLVFENQILKEFTSSGSLEGRNITGRPIKMIQTSPKRYNASCLDSGFVMPSQGVENWQIFRNETQSVSHNVIYEQETDCINKATITLQDGRVMVFRQ